VSIPWLSDNPSEFPDVRLALKDPDGLLAVGGDLSSERLREAYKRGIFPWYEEYLSSGELSPILWWSPDPRCVLRPKKLKIRRSLVKSIRNSGFELSCDNAFEAVISACAEARKNSEGTWINPQMIEAYCGLHTLGSAHSIECWKDDELVGGLYGISIGNMFYGESMFQRETDASKVALSYLCSLLDSQGNDLIDCQVSNSHLESLGAENIQIEEFLSQSMELNQKSELHFPKEKIYAEILIETDFFQNQTS
jgi:leucyl/phenylalanyl-tRNA--protein transferase